MRRRTMLRGAVAALACLAVTVGPLSIASAQSPLDFDFESASQASTGWTAGSCHAPTWLGANDGNVFRSNTVVNEGAFSLGLPIRMAGTSWDQAGVNCILPDPRPHDLTSYTAVTFDVYAPAAGLRADLVFNDPWHQSSTPLRDLAPGWNTLTYDITPSSPDFPGGKAEARELVLRVIGQNVTAQGFAYFDDLRFVSSGNPIVKVLAPLTDATLTTPLGSPYKIRAKVTPAQGRSIAAVTWSAGSQSGPLVFDAASGEWVGDWDTWAGGEGVRTVRITATDTEGGQTVVPITVLVRNSQIGVDIVTPTFDSQLSGKVEVVARVKADPRFPLESVRLRADGRQLKGSLGPADANGWQTATFAVPTQQLLDDGAHTLKVVATDAHFGVADEVDVMVDNRRAPWDFVRAQGTSFATRGGKFRFVGANEYELFTRMDDTTEHVQETLSGRVIPANTVITWQELIDRQMLEARRHHLTVLRTWAFDENPEAFAFQPQLGVYNEAAFRKLDYIVDSARRHGIRVILTLSNYWPDYGGIGRYTQQLGLANKNQFFREESARTAYRNYVAHLVNRVNTVNGVAYKDDPTVFAWELMNEPRMDCADDPTPDKRYCDKTGQVLRNWIASESAYIKSLDPNHMVAAGAEAHGLVQTPSGPFQWARDDEGNGNDPWSYQDVPSTDFLSFHPYPNAWWAQYTFAQTHDLIVGLTRTGVARGKPVVMSEYGIVRSQPITDQAGNYLGLRVEWYRLLLDDCYRNGCAGTNVWMMADWSDSELNVNLYLPQADAVRDAPIVALFDDWGSKLARQ
jgi:hypothetical protein